MSDASISNSHLLNILKVCTGYENRSRGYGHREINIHLVDDLINNVTLLNIAATPATFGYSTDNRRSRQQHLVKVQITKDHASNIWLKYRQPKITPATFG
ncbi:hypothetical protein BgiMline_027101 [Biomphalaria glabrata]|nr:hypothetical protein BgiMline_032753 [Biomphalaria glabrata]